jgi:hypothetical protein
MRDAKCEHHRESANVVSLHSTQQVSVYLLWYDRHLVRVCSTELRVVTREVELSHTSSVLSGTTHFLPKRIRSFLRWLNNPLCLMKRSTKGVKESPKNDLQCSPEWNFLFFFPKACRKLNVVRISADFAKEFQYRRYLLFLIPSCIRAFTAAWPLPVSSVLNENEYAS